MRTTSVRAIGVGAVVVVCLAALLVVHECRKAEAAKKAEMARRAEAAREAAKEAELARQAEIARQAAAMEAEASNRARSARRALIKSQRETLDRAREDMAKAEAQRDIELQRLDNQSKLSKLYWGG